MSDVSGHEEKRRSTVVSVVAPMYNEETSIAAFLEQVAAVVSSLPNYKFEILLVDDGSSDATVREAKRAQNHFPIVRIVELSRNFGHQAAITAGVFLANGDCVIVMDADLQDPPSVIPRLLQAWESGADVAYAVREQRKGESAFKRATAALYYRILRGLSDTNIPVNTGDFRLMSRRVVETLRSMPERDRYMRGMVAWVGFTQVPVPYDRDPRHSGVSKYPLAKMIKLGLSGVVGFSDKPLFVAIYAGFVVLALAVAGLGYVALSLVFGWGTVVRGWTSVVVSVMFFSAVQLIFMGVIGLYVSRIFVEAKQRPLYIVKRDTNHRDPSDHA